MSQGEFVSKEDLLDGKDQDHKVDPGHQGEAPTNSLIQACTSLTVSQHAVWLHSIWLGPSKEAECVISPRSRLKCIRRDKQVPESTESPQCPSILPSHHTFTFHFHALEKEMATHSSILAWRIPGMGEPGGLPSLGSHRVGHD